jgi:hypothetical protein
MRTVAGSAFEPGERGSLISDPSVGATPCPLAAVALTETFHRGWALARATFVRLAGPDARIAASTADSVVVSRT